MSRRLSLIPLTSANAEILTEIVGRSVAFLSLSIRSIAITRSLNVRGEIRIIIDHCDAREILPFINSVSREVLRIGIQLCDVRVPGRPCRVGYD